jgi:mannose-6-phosphate isomerase-like protein (cupin superfamily)
MQLVTGHGDAIDLTTRPVHLGLGSRASAVDGFAWDPEALGAYSAAVAQDGGDGRLVMVFEDDRSWDVWERHPAGEEVVICLAGRMTVFYETDTEDVRIELGPYEAMINPAGAWHTADIDQPVRFLTITPGLGTEHRPR